MEPELDLFLTNRVRGTRTESVSLTNRVRETDRETLTHLTMRQMCLYTVYRVDCSPDVIYWISFILWRLIECQGVKGELCKDSLLWGLSSLQNTAKTSLIILHGFQNPSHFNYKKYKCNSMKDKQQQIQAIHLPMLL